MKHLSLAPKDNVVILVTRDPIDSNNPCVQQLYRYMKRLFFDNPTADATRSLLSHRPIRAALALTKRY